VAKRVLRTLIVLALVSVVLVSLTEFPESVSSGTRPLTKTLISKAGGYYWVSQSLTLEEQLPIYKAYGVSWVVFYSIPSTAQVTLVHSYDIGVIVYQNALAAEYTDLRGRGYDDNTIRDWAQWGSGCVYVKPPSPDPNIPSCAGDSANQVRISPYSGFLDAVLLPQITNIINVGADGIFLDVLFLKPDADSNPHFTTRYNEWKVQNPSGSFQDFRYYSIHYYASRMYGLVKSINPSAILVISNNNVFQPADRETYALDIGRLQDVADVLMLEFNDVDQTTPEGAVEWGVAGERSGARGQPVTIPIWVHYLTNQADRFNAMIYYMNTKYASYDFGWWAYSVYMWNHPVTQTSTTTTSRETSTTSQTTSVTTSTETSSSATSQTSQTTSVTTSTETSTTIETTSTTTSRGTSTTCQTTVITTAFEDMVIQVASNSSVSSFVFDSTRRLLNFTVSGPSGTFGFVNVTIAKTILSGRPIVLIDGTEHSASITEDENFWHIYATYQHSEHHVTIGDSTTIGEFPETIPLLFVLMSVVLILLKRSTSKRSGS
jgi:hypothetical protein